MPSVGRLRYLDAPARGAGRPRGTLVLIHGFPFNARLWEPQLALAGGGWRVVAPELRGFGDGATGPAGASVDDYAGDVIDLLDALHVEEAVIGGLSMGGYVTFAMFRHAPRYFQGMVLADTRSQADTPEGVEGRKRMIQLVRDRGVQAVTDEMMPRLLSDATTREQPEVVEQLRTLMLSSSASAVVGGLTALMTRPDSTPLLASIRCPTLIIVGAEDTLTPPALSEQMQRAIAGSQLVIIPAAGHLTNLEAPDAFNTAAGGFLAKRA